MALAAEQRLRLLEAIAGSADLEELLELLSTEIDRVGGFDGYLIRLADVDRRELRCERAQLPRAFEAMGDIYKDFPIPLDGADLSAKACVTGETLHVARDAMDQLPDSTRVAFERWRAEEIAMIPLGRTGDCAGTLVLFAQVGAIAPETLETLWDVGAMFDHPLVNATRMRALVGQQANVERLLGRHKDFLGFINEINGLTSVQEIYDRIAEEFVRRYGVDLVGIVLREEDELRLRSLHASDPRFDPVRERVWTLYEANSYSLNPADGATPMVYSQNARALFRDVRAVRHLPMSPLDRRSLDAMGTPRTVLIFPIREKDTPVGVLWLITLTEPLDLDDLDRELLELASGFIGSSIANARLYSQEREVADENARLYRELARTTEQLQDSHRQLEKHSRLLEDRVQARTAELQMRLAEEKRLKAALEAANAELEVAKQELDQALEQARAGLHAKERFLSTISHEMRTPLTAILGNADAVLRGEELDPGFIAEASRRNGRRLLDLINDCLDMANLDVGRMELRQDLYSPPDVLTDVESAMGALAREKGLWFKLVFTRPVPLRATGDERRIRQALFNLCHNAVKFTSEGGVEVSASCDPEAGLLTVRVRDTGAGVTPERFNRLAQPFERGDGAHEEHHGGAGLGLSLTKALVEAMGGTLAVSEWQGGGSLFELTIPTGDLARVPLAATPEEGSPRAAPLEGAERPRLRGRVLVAEDGEDNQLLLRSLIESTGAEALVVDDGEKAVESGLANAVDLVLMDIQMPRLNGLDATAMLRESGFSAPIVAVTADIFAEEAERYRAAGFDDCLSKPIDVVRFDAMLSRFLSATEETAEVPVVPVDMTLLVQRFLSGLPDSVSDIRAALIRADWPALALEAHKLRGTAGSFGFPEVSDAAAEIETLVPETPPDRARLAIERLAHLCATLTAG